MSRVAIQITQETAPVAEHLRVDFSALVPVSWDPVCPSDAEAAVAAFERERAARLPLRPWSDLPKSQASWTSVLNGFADADLSAVALLMDGQVYLQEVGTRPGPHPFPEWMRHGVYSATKTMGLGLSTLYLAKRELVLDYLRLRRQRKSSGLCPKPAGIERRPGIPEAPKPTV